MHLTNFEYNQHNIALQLLIMAITPFPGTPIYRFLEIKWHFDSLEHIGLVAETIFPHNK